MLTGSRRSCVTLLGTLCLLGAAARPPGLGGCSGHCAPWTLVLCWALGRELMGAGWRGPGGSGRAVLLPLTCTDRQPSQISHLHLPRAVQHTAGPGIVVQHGVLWCGVLWAQGAALRGAAPQQALSPRLYLSMGDTGRHQLCCRKPQCRVQKQHRGLLGSVCLGIRRSSVIKMPLN